MLKDTSQDSLLQDSFEHECGELEQFQYLKIENQMKDINSNSTLNINSLQQVLTRLAVVLGKQHMWLSTRMANIESLCKEFIDQEDKDDLMDTHSDTSQFEPIGAQFDFKNNNNTSLAQFNDTELNSQNNQANAVNLKSNEPAKFKMNKVNQGNDLHDMSADDGNVAVKSSLLNQTKQKKDTVVIINKDNQIDIVDKNKKEKVSDQINNQKIEKIDNLQKSQPSNDSKKLQKSQPSNDSKKDQSNKLSNLDMNENRKEKTPTPDNMLNSVKSFASQNFDEESNGYKHLQKEGDQDQKEIPDISMREEEVKEESRPVFKKAKTPKEKKDSNNALEKTINKVRESLLNDIENFCQEMIETSVNKNFASLNIAQMLKVPENKIDPIRQKLADLYRKFDLQNESNNDINAKIEKAFVNINLLSSKINEIDQILLNKANTSDITNIYNYFKKLITRVEQEELKNDMEFLVKLKDFNETKDKIDDFISDVERNYTPKALFSNTKEDFLDKFQNISINKADIAHVNNLNDDQTRNFLNNNQTLIKLEQKITSKFADIDATILSHNNLISSKESIEKCDKIRIKIETLETRERVNLLEHTIMPVLNSNSHRLDQNDINQSNFIREIKRIEEKVENKPDRQEIESIDKKMKNSVDKDIHNTILNKQEELCNNLDNRVKHIDSSTKYSREDFNSRIEGLRSEFITMSQDQANRDSISNSPLKTQNYTKTKKINQSSNNQNQISSFQSQQNKNVLLIILGLLKHVFQKDDNITHLKGSLYSSAQNLYQITGNLQDKDNKLRIDNNNKLEEFSSIILQHDGTLRTEQDSMQLDFMNNKVKTKQTLTQSNERYKEYDYNTILRPKSTTEIKKRLNSTSKFRQSQNKVAHNQFSNSSNVNLNISMNNLNNDNQKSSSVFPVLKIN